MTTLFEVSEDFALETGIQLPAEKLENVLGREIQESVFEQLRINLGQLGVGAKQEIGAELGLIDDPAVGTLTEPGLLE